MGNREDKQSFGRDGSVLLGSSSGNVEGQYCAFVVVEDAVLTSASIKNFDETRSETLAGKTLIAGYTQYGDIQAINVLSGSVIAYYQS